MSRLRLNRRCQSRAVGSSRAKFHRRSDGEERTKTLMTQINSMLKSSRSKIEAVRQRRLLHQFSTKIAEWSQVASRWKIGKNVYWWADHVRYTSRIWPRNRNFFTSCSSNRLILKVLFCLSLRGLNSQADNKWTSSWTTIARRLFRSAVSSMLKAFRRNQGRSKFP